MTDIEQLYKSILENLGAVHTTLFCQGSHLISGFGQAVILIFFVRRLVLNVAGLLIYRIGKAQVCAFSVKCSFLYVVVNLNRYIC